MSEFNLTFWDLKRDGTRYRKQGSVCIYIFKDEKILADDTYSRNPINEMLHSKYCEIKEPTKEEIFIKKIEGRKIRLNFWSKNRYFIVSFIEGDKIHGTCETGYYDWWDFLNGFELNKDGNKWEFYKEKKRYWQWKINFNGWLRTDYYFDDKGLDSSGESRFVGWDNIEKEKIEDDWIEV